MFFMQNLVAGMDDLYLALIFDTFFKAFANGGKNNAIVFAINETYRRVLFPGKRLNSI